MEKTRENSFYVNFGKPLLDSILVLIFLLLFWWVFILCAIAIIADDGWPVIYKQIRVGQFGKQFGIYKFRSMIKQADKIGPTSTADNDSRITPSGRFLRKTSLDELPQLFNVLKGDMSLVGYRPDVVHDDDDYSQIKYLLKPGITGFAQVNGRSQLTLEERNKWEELYPYKVSLLTDISVIFRTILIVINRKGTN